MQVEASEFGSIENGLRQDHAIRHDHGGVRLAGEELLQRILRLQCRRRRHGNAEASCLLLDRAHLQLHAAPGRLCRPGIDRSDLMAMSHELEQGRHRELGRAHEDQTKRHSRSYPLKTSRFYSSWPGIAVRRTAPLPLAYALAILRLWLRWKPRRGCPGQARA